MHALERAQITVSEAAVPIPWPGSDDAVEPRRSLAGAHRLHVVLVGAVGLGGRQQLGPEHARVVAVRLSGDAGEAVALSTRDRTEVYLVDHDVTAAAERARAELRRLSGLTGAELYTLTDESAARHLLRVAAGLVPGEAKILGQLRAAYEQALAAGATGPVLNRLFRQALRVGRRVRAERELGPEAILAEETDRFRDWLRALDVVPAITFLRRRADQIRAERLARAERRLRGLSPAQRRAVEALAARIVDRLLHVPTVRLKEAAASPEGLIYARAVQDLFGADEAGR